MKNDFRAFLRERLARHAGLLACSAVAALGALAYANSLSNSFQFDDVQGIVLSPLLRDMRNIPAFFTDVRTSSIAGGHDWRPVVLGTLALNYAMDGLDPAVFRLTNLLFHLGTACLIFLVLREIFRARPERFPAGGFISPELFAALPAALFAVHPVNSEAVNHIWARSSVLAAFFSLLSFYCFARGPWSAAGKAKPLWGLAGLACFAVGLGAKATVITLPAVLLLYEGLFLSSPEKPFWREPKKLAKYFPPLALSAAYVLFRFAYLPGFFRRVGGGSADISATTYLLTQSRAWIYYIRQFFWPHPLIADFPGFGWSRSPWEPGVLLSLAAIAIILALAWRVRKSDPLLSFFTLWFFIALLPEASFIPLLDAVNGYRAYPANAALAVVAAVLSLKAALWIWRRLKNQSVSRFRLGYGAAWIAVFCALAGATMARNRDWKDARTLWSDGARKDPTNARAYANLALSFIQSGDYQKAGELLDRAVALGPKSGSAFMMRGYLSFRLGRGDLGLADLTRAIELDRRVPMPFYYRGEVYRKKGEHDKALADYRSALALMPFYADAYLGTALVHMDKHEYDKAMEACAKMTAVDSTDARGYNCQGILLLEQNRVPDAVGIYQKGVLHAPQNSGLWYGLGLAYEQNRMYKEAADAFEIAGRLTK